MFSGMSVLNYQDASDFLLRWSFRVLSFSTSTELYMTAAPFWRLRTHYLGTNNWFIQVYAF